MSDPKKEVINRCTACAVSAAPHELINGLCLWCTARQLELTAKAAFDAAAVMAKENAGLRRELEQAQWRATNLAILIADLPNTPR